MKISFTGAGSLLQNQSLFHLELIPGKDLKWKTSLNFRGGDLGSFYYADIEFDASAYLDSPHYQLCIPLNTHGDEYTLNGSGASKMFLLTPTSATCAQFPRKFDELHFVFNAEIFVEMAKKNEAYELLHDDKIFLYEDYV